MSLVVVACLHVGDRIGSRCVVFLQQAGVTVRVVEILGRLLVGVVMVLPGVT